MSDPINKFDPNGLDWIYSQSTGQIHQVDGSGNRIPGTGGTGYSGAPGHVNNSDSQNLRDLGPIPQGTYDIGPQGDIPRAGGGAFRQGMTLSPVDGTNTFGRDGFVIHGSNDYTQRNASRGCPIFEPAIRNEIGRSGDTRLRVVP